MEGASQDRGTFKGIAATLLAIAFLAERTAVRSFPVRFLVLAILFRAEAIARAFVARETGTSVAEHMEACWPYLDRPCLDEPHGLYYGAADAQLLALRLRILAAVLGMLADTESCNDDLSAERPEGWSSSWFADSIADLPPYVGVAPLPPLLLVVRLPATRRALRPPDTS